MNHLSFQIANSQFQQCSLTSCIHNPEKSPIHLKKECLLPQSYSAQLKKGSLSKPSLFQRLYNAYLNAIRQFVTFLQKYEWYATSLILGTLFAELLPAIKAAFMSAANLKKDFNFYGMNPKVLTTEELKKQPILLIHGNYHNQSAWLSLAKKLQSSNLGPVYTVNLPCGAITDKDYEILDDKLEEIKGLYKKANACPIKVNVIGHSRGGFLASEMAWKTLKKDKEGNQYWKRSEDIGKIISIGHPLDPEETQLIQLVDENFKDRLYEITGEHDILASNHKSLLPHHRQSIINSGHLGLLYSDETHKIIIEQLQNSL